MKICVFGTLKIGLVEGHSIWSNPAATLDKFQPWTEVHLYLLTCGAFCHSKQVLITYFRLAVKLEITLFYYSLLKFICGSRTSWIVVKLNEH
jgi:hypothetical protein